MALYSIWKRVCSGFRAIDTGVDVRCILFLLIAQLLAQQSSGVPSAARDQPNAQRYAWESRIATKPLSDLKITTYVDSIAAKLLAEVENRPLVYRLQVIAGGV